MFPARFAPSAFKAVRTGLVAVSIFQLAVGSSFAANPSEPSRDADTTTPIKHVIVIVGENRSFDHVFATYVPKNNQKIWNLLSEGIIKADGTPGANFGAAEQKAASDNSPDTFMLSPATESFPGSKLPAPLTGGPVDS
jgi:phospholipase C